MISVFHRFSELWPAESREALEPLLSKIDCLLYPDESERLRSIRKPAKTLVIFRHGDLKDLMKLVHQGFEHCVQASRADFAQEVLVAALMISRPQAFAKNPLPFFFSGFRSAKEALPTEAHLTLPLQRTSDKAGILERLSAFLDQNPRLRGVQDLCAQAADELIMNALFCAPVKANGEPMNLNLPRTTPLQLPPGKEATFFATFSDQRVIVGCQDLYGSLDQAGFREHLRHSFSENTIAPRAFSAGAGLGMKTMIENCANFYVDVEKGRRSLVACGFLLNGMKANLMSHKHLHIGFG